MVMTAKRRGLIRVLVGAFFLLVPRDAPVPDRGLVNVGLQNPTVGSLRVPAWLVFAVLVALFLTLGYIALEDV